MAGSKQKSLTRLDNNYQLNLRYPDINEFLKDTFFSLQDNQTIERSLMANPRVVLNSAKNTYNITIAGFSLQVLLSDIIIYAFSPNQEVINDFLIVPEIFGIVLDSFTADRATPDARLQSIQSMSLEGSDKVANFNINLAGKKIANILTELFTTRREELKVALEITDDFSLVTYILNNLFSLSFTFFCSYRLEQETEYRAAFRVPVELNYLSPSLLNQTILQSSKIESPRYSPLREVTPVYYPQLTLKSIYKLNGTLQLVQSFGSDKYLDPVKYPIYSTTTLQELTSTFRTAEYVWSTISGVENKPPLVTYNYIFSVLNSTAKYAGVFSTFQSSATSTGSFNLKAENYKVRLRSYKESGTNFTKYDLGIFFDLSNASNAETSLHTLVARRAVDGGLETYAPNLFLQADLLNPADKTQIFVPHSTFERCTILTTFNPRFVYTVNSSTQTTFSGCTLYTSANTDEAKTQFSKITQRVLTASSGLANFSSARLGMLSPKISLTFPTTNSKGTLLVGLEWNSLNTSELAALYQLTTASGLRVSLLDSFMNVLAVTDKVYSTNNKLSQSESPLLNPSIFYSAEVKHKGTINTAGTSISGLLATKQGIAESSLRILENSSTNVSPLIEYVANPNFSLISNIYCVANWVEVINKVNQQKWSSTIHQIASDQITIDGRSISVSATQKASIASSLNLPSSIKNYVLYILLPWSTVRDLSTAGVSIVRSILTSGKYTYAYALKV